MRFIDSKTTLIFRRLQRQEQPLRSDVEEVEMKRTFRDLPPGYWREPLNAILKDGVLQLRQRLTADGKPCVADAVRRWPLLERAAQELKQARRGFAAAQRAWR